MPVKIVTIARPHGVLTEADADMWKITVITHAGRWWVLVDPTLRGAIKLFRQCRRAKCWDKPPIRPEDAA
jgi:hypothetical protein